MLSALVDYSLEIDGAGLRLVQCAGYFGWADGNYARLKPAGCYIERHEGGQWVPIEGPFWGGPPAGYPEKAENRLRELCAALDNPPDV